MTQQDTAFALLESFQRNIATLQQGLASAQPVIENLKSVLALQWLLGNLGIVLVFGLGLKAYFFARKALRAMHPGYSLPHRWLVVHLVLTLVALVGFNVLPLGIDIRPEPRHAAAPAAR